jgi:methionyl aminopeptidase
LARMREAGRIVARVLAALRERIKPGVMTIELDALAEDIIVTSGAVPSFKGYRGFPAALCVAVNEEIVHGIPGQRVLQEGDIASVDVGTIYRGYQGDAAITVGVGPISPQAERLIEVTAGCLAAGIEQCRPRNRLGDVSWAIQHYAESRGYTVIREYTGHGIGRDMHEDPQIPNFGRRKRGVRLKPGMTFALEPMVTEGGWHTRVLADKWTVVTASGQWAAHFEHTIAITENEPRVLTLL